MDRGKDEKTQRGERRDHINRAIGQSERSSNCRAKIFSKMRGTLATSRLGPKSGGISQRVLNSTRHVENASQAGICTRERVKFFPWNVGEGERTDKTIDVQEGEGKGLRAERQIFGNSVGESFGRGFAGARTVEQGRPSRVRPLPTCREGGRLEVRETRKGSGDVEREKKPQVRVVGAVLQ